MSLPRLSIGRLMAAIAIVALNVTLIRYTISDPQLLIGGAIPCLVLQWAAFAVIRRRGRARAFWLGFLAFGSVLAASFIGAMLYTVPAAEVAGVSRTGPPVINPTPPIYVAWFKYKSYFITHMSPLFSSPSAKPSLTAILAWSLCWAVYMAIPPLVFGWLGGLAVGMIFGAAKGSRRPNILGDTPPDSVPQTPRPVPWGPTGGPIVETHQRS